MFGTSKVVLSKTMTMAKIHDQGGVMVEKDTLQHVLHAGITVRCGLKAGRTMCYQEINGAWVPIFDPNYPPYPVPPTPTPPDPNIQWLNCQSCQGTRVSDRALQNVNCEVCRM
jgi:hypothetical protein